MKAKYYLLKNYSHRLANDYIRDLKSESKITKLLKSIDKANDFKYILVENSINKDETESITNVQLLTECYKSQSTVKSLIGNFAMYDYTSLIPVVYRESGDIELI